jgi:hypothetical protein
MEVESEAIHINPLLPPLGKVLSWFFEGKKNFLLPYYAEVKKQQKLINKIERLFKKLGEEYKYIEVYYNTQRYTCISIQQEIYDVKMDVIETVFKKLNKEPKKKIIIVI